MFNKSKDNEIAGREETETIIGPSVKIKGDFHGQGDIIIEGELEGGLQTEGNINIKEKAIIKGNIKAKNVSISGDVVGNLDVDGYLELSATANVLGDLKVKGFSIAKGAKFNGNCNMIIDENK